MSNLVLESIEKTMENIVKKHNQSDQLAIQIQSWIRALMNGEESLDNKKDVVDRLKVILNQIEVNDGY